MICMRLNPRDPSIFFRYSSLSLAHFLQKSFDEAREWADRAVARKPDWWLGHASESGENRRSRRSDDCSVPAGGPVSKPDAYDIPHRYPRPGWKGVAPKQSSRCRPPRMTSCRLLRCELRRVGSSGLGALSFRTAHVAVHL